jgi:hypothetical protein
MKGLEQYSILLEHVEQLRTLLPRALVGARHERRAVHRLVHWCRAPPPFADHLKHLRVLAFGRGTEEAAT